MKLAFFLGISPNDDNDWLEVVNSAIRDCKFKFDLSVQGASSIHCFKDLCAELATTPDPAEITIALLHWNECADFVSAIHRWNVQRRENLIVILFSRDVLHQAHVRQAIRAGEEAGFARITWLNLGLQSAVASAEFQAFFQWLDGRMNPTLPQICEALDRHLSRPGSRGDYQELLRPIAILCEGALAVHQARLGPSASRVPEIAFKRVSEAQWWRKCLGLSSHNQTVTALRKELEPKLPKLDELPPELAVFLNAIFGDSAVPEETVRAARDYCRRIAW